MTTSPEGWRETIAECVRHAMQRSPECDALPFGERTKLRQEIALATADDIIAKATAILALRGSET